MGDFVEGGWSCLVGWSMAGWSLEWVQPMEAAGDSVSMEHAFAGWGAEGKGLPE